MVVGVIPARYASTRLPGKPLALIAGEPMVAHVWRRARQAACLDRVLIATDDARVAEAGAAFGAEVVMTSPDHQSGTDRLAEVAESLVEARILVNIQGDEPLLDPRCLEQMVRALRSDPDLPMSSLRVRIEDPEEAASPNVVKVVVDPQDFALYFSRARIPHDRDASGAPCYKHLGLYAYRRDFLLTYARLPQTPLEKTEKLEQLRALEHGYRIRVPLTEWNSHSVDTPQDLERVRRIFDAAGAGRRPSG